jgi:predicted hexulose-6-phosphate isomerase
MRETPIGLYEKALPTYLSWEERLAASKDAGYGFMEMSVDETDARLGRLKWSKAEKIELLMCMRKLNMPILTMCLSGNRRFPIGSENAETRLRGIQLIKDAIDFALEMGIRIIQLAGYDEYANPSNDATLNNFAASLQECIQYAEKRAVMLAMETMENELMNSIRKAKRYVDTFDSSWFKIYPDIGNLTATGQDIESDYETGKNDIVALHLKDTRPGIFRGIPFGEGNVDFVSFFKLLTRENYPGIFVVEMWSDETEDSIRLVKDTRIFLMEKMERSMEQLRLEQIRRPAKEGNHERNRNQTAYEGTL